MARPEESFFPWATLANFSTGSKTGQPTKSKPNTTVFNNGLIAGTPFPSQIFNWVTENAGAWFASIVEELDVLNTATTVVKTLATGTNNNVAMSAAELNADVMQLGVGSGSAVLTGLQAPSSSTYKSGWKLVVITAAMTVAHSSTSSLSANRLQVTGASDWAAAVGDMALLRYGVSNWVIHPLKPPGAGGGAAENEITATLEANANDWNPSGWQDCTQVTVTVNGGPFKLNGLAAPAAGKPRVKRIVVAAGTLLIGYSGPTAANQVSIPRLNSALPNDAAIGTGETATLVYANDNRWHLLLTARPSGYTGSSVFTAGTVNALALGSGYLTDGIQIVAGGDGPHVINGIAAPPQNAVTQGGWKLVRFSIDGTVTHESGSATTAGDRVVLTSGGNWGFQVGDYALLAYDRAVARWILHPLKTTAAGLTTVLTASETLTFADSRREVWNGGANPSFGADLTGARDNGGGTTLFPPGSLNSVAFSTTLDPTQTLQYVHDDSGAAYLMTRQFLAGSCVVVDFRKVQFLS